MTGMITPLHVLFLGMMFWAAISDLMTFRIFNSLILIMIAGFFALTLVHGLPFSQSGWILIGWHLLAAFVALLFFLIFYALNQMGAGDVKFIAAIALWFGWNPVAISFVLYAMIAGGLLTLLLLAWRRLPLPPVFERARFVKRLYIRRYKTPYGISLGAVGAYMSFSAPLLA